MDGTPATLGTCSYAQRWLFALDSVVTDPAEYNVSQAVLVQGRLDPGRLQAAVDQVLARHEILRTRYHAVAGVPCTELLDAGRVVIEESSAPDAAGARAVVTAAAARAFELAVDLPLRVLLVSLSDGRSAVALVAHHIAVDAWSLAVLWRELGRAYDGAELGAPPPGYAAVADPELAPDDDELSFWADALAEPAWGDLPGDRSRPARRSGRGGHVTVPVEPALAARWRQAATEQRCTPFTMLLAAVHLVVARWTGAEQTSVGTVVSGRAAGELDDVVGFFVNTVVLRERVRPASTVGEFVRQVRDTSLAAYMNATVPYAELVSRLSPGRAPLFNVMATMQDDTAAEFRPAGVAAQPLDLPSTSSKFDLSVMATDRADGGLGIDLAYAADIFDAATIERFGGHLTTVLGALCTEPERRLAQLSLLTTAERAELLAAAELAAEPLDERGIADLFRTVAAAHPMADAVRAGRHRLSYAELDRRSEQVAAWLQEQGIGRGDRVGLRLSRTPDLLVALLGILKSGGCYVALEPTAPAERVRLVLADSGARVVLTDPDLAALTDLPAGAAADADGPVTGRQVTTPGGPADLAYVMYTSGSTGRPKGVLVTQQGVLNLSRDLVRRLRLGPGDVVAAVAPHSFDMSVPELITPLLAGAAIRLVPRNAAVEADLLAAELADVTFAQLTPSHWQLLLGSGWSDPNLRAGCGAEPFPPALAGRLRAAVGELWNFYGPTETTVWSTAAAVTGGTDGRPVPIGGPLRNTFAIVLDEHLRPVPIGVPGELCLGGAGVADGYSNAPALTAASFVPDEFHPGQRLYRTGDIVRRLPDGQLEFHARADHQVKVRGFRIELAEVESALERHPDVSRATATVLGEDADRTLVGFVVLRTGLAPTEDTLTGIRQFAGRLLPSYMVPAVLRPIETLPLSPNGKVDRRQLPRDIGRPARQAGALRTPAERAVAGAFEEVLGLADLGPDDDFFALGGHSLNGGQVVAVLRAAFPASSVRLLFDHPTVAGLAAVLAGTGDGAAPAAGTAPADGAAPAAGQPASTSGGRAPAAPPPAAPSPAQQRLWLLDQLSPAPAEYNVQRVVRLTGRLDADRLAAALTDLHRRHPALGSSFPTVGGRPALVTGGPAPVLARATALDLAAALRQAQDDIDTPFAVASGPLWRARLITLSQQDHLLVLVFHHIIVDGASFPIIWRDLEARYRGGTLSPAPSPGPSAAAADPGGLRFWQELLAGAAGAELPTDRPRPLRRSGGGGSCRFRLADPTVTELHDLARALGTTYFVVTLAAFAAVLGRYGDAAEAVVGTPVSGRSGAAEQELVGCFVNTLALRLTGLASGSFTDLVRTVGARATEAFAHRNVPFEQVVEAVDPARDLSRNPIFQVMFATPASETVTLAGLAGELLPTPATTAKFDLSVELDVTGDGLLIYDSDLFDEQTAVSFADRLANFLHAAARAPHLPVVGLARPAVDGPRQHPARAPFLSELLQTVGAPGSDAGVGRVVLRAGELELSGPALLDRVRRAAAALAGRGVGRGSVLALTMPPGPDLTIGMLAASWLGAAFMPLNPADPRSRLEEQLRIGRASHEFTELPSEPAAPVPPPAPLTGDDLAAVYFTSGSTGRPKAVLERHGGIASYLRYLREVIGVSRTDTALQLAPPTFDASLRDGFGVLTAGGRTVLLPADARRDAYQILEAIHRDGVTVLLSIVPSMLRTLIRAARGRTVELRLVLVSGEALDAQLAAEVARWAPKARLVNQYGPTECTMTSTFHEVTDGDVQAGVIPIGRPLPTTAGYVLDRGGLPQPDGALGEFYLAGAGLARGYDGAALTAGRFLPDPFGPPGSRMFRTGDRVHRRHDGRLIFHGREDNQIKVRGVRVELAEIEAALARCPEVAAAAVALRDGDLVAYLTGDWDVSEVRQELARSLPAVLHPAHLQRLATLPVNVNGKLDRALLPAPDTGGAAPALRPRDTAELMMAEAWQRVLGRGAVGVRDDFFAIGGNSLKAVELVELLRSRYQVTLPLHLLFSHPTVEKLCPALPRHDRPQPLAVRLSDGAPGNTPLFLVHPQSGEVCSYLNLVRAMPSEQPVYGIEAVGYSSDDPPLDEIELMAERYLAEVRRVAPAGPYLLGGWSFGANVAFEMAHRLEQAGETVALLAVIDGRAFGSTTQESWYLDKDEATRFGLVAGLPEDRAEQLAELDEQSVLGLLLAHARDRGEVSDRADSATMRRMVAVFAANGRAAERYSTGARIHAPIELFTATERHPTLTNPVVDPVAWQARTTGPVQVRPVPGTHHDVIDAEHAAAVAIGLTEAITAAGPASPGALPHVLALSSEGH